MATSVFSQFLRTSSGPQAEAAEFVMGDTNLCPRCIPDYVPGSPLASLRPHAPLLPHLQELRAQVQR